MAYNKFTLKKVQTRFGLILNTNATLFQNISPAEVSPRLQSFLTDFVPLATKIDTEKARSEWIVAPILSELYKPLQDKISLFSGINFDVDPKQQLTGFCDFLISRDPNQLAVSSPVIAIVEAKKGDVMTGLGQAIATMIGAQLFNLQENNSVKIIYGVSTTGTNWKFLKLIDQTVYVDADEYYITDLGKIMGILTHLVLN